MFNAPHKLQFTTIMVCTMAMVATINSPAMSQDADFAVDLPNSHYEPAQAPSPIEKEILPAAAHPIAAPGHQDFNGDKAAAAENHALPFPARQFPKEWLDVFRTPAKAAFNLADVRVQEMPMVRIADGSETLVQLRLETRDADEPVADRILRLHQFSTRAPEAKLLVQVEGGMLVEQPWPEVTTYRGTIDGMPGVDVVGSIIDGKVSLMLLPDDPSQDIWFVQPLNDGMAGMPDGVHVVYRSSDVIAQPRSCGVEALAGAPNANDAVGLAQRLAGQWPPQTSPPDQNDTEDRSNGGTDGGGTDSVNVRCQLALDADYEYYLANGSSILNTVYEMERMLNFVGPIFQNQVAIAYTETTIIIRSNINDPYNTGLTGSGMRDEFRNNWIANHAGVTRDAALLFSNRTSTDGFIGFAYFAGICNANNGNNSGYCWAGTFWSTVLTNKVATVAHELGHVWNAAHCDGASDCGLMNSSITGSWSFDSVANAAIVAHRDSRPCLDPWFNPTYVNGSYVGTETGSISQPWNTIIEGLDACLVGGTLNVQAGNYFQNPNIFKAKNINALNGTVRIGSN